MDDPRIEDADHKGRFLSFKNFAWSGMSGVGGYVQDFNYFRNNATVDKIRIDEQGSNSIKVTILTTGIGNAIYIPKNGCPMLIKNIFDLVMVGTIDIFVKS